MAQLPDEVSRAAELCAVPNELDDGIGLLLLEEIGQMNGTSPRMLGELKHAPFVSASGDTWRLAANARVVLTERLRAENPAAFLAAHRVTGDAFRSRRDALHEKASPRARRLQWNLAFHLAPVDADWAIAELDDLVERAATIRALGDMRAVVALVGAQHDWLGGRELDVLYYEGRLAYEDGDFQTAAAKLEPVWVSGSDRRKRLFAGHFLGAIWGRPDSGHRWDEATATLLAAARLAADMEDLRGEGVILHTLGALLLRRDASGDRNSATKHLRRAVVLSRAVGDRRTEAIALVSLASVLMKSRRAGAHEEAEKYLRRRLELEELRPDLDQGLADAELGRLLAKSGPARRDEAILLLEQVIQRHRKRGDARQLAFALEALGELLARGDQPQSSRAIEALTESLEIGRERRDRRHQAIVLSRLATIAERENRPDDAIEHLTEVLRLNRARKDNRRADAAQRRIDELRADGNRT
jgi:tetratricopeptide (TPR) repeat protein